MHGAAGCQAHQRHSGRRSQLAFESPSPTPSLCQPHPPLLVLFLLCRQQRRAGILIATRLALAPLAAGLALGPGAACAAGATLENLKVSCCKGGV